MLTSDENVWDESVDRSPPEKPFIEKQRLWLQDMQNGAYNGQVMFSLEPLANNGLYMDYSNAYFEFPILISAKGDGTADYSKMMNAYSIGIKSGNTNFISQMQVDLNNKTVVQLTQNLNVLCNFKTLAGFSVDDLEKLGPTIGFYPDDADSIVYHAAASADGDGYTNNRNTIATTTTPFGVRAVTNSGFLKRQKITTANSTVNIASLPTLGDTSKATTQFGNEGRPFFFVEGTGAAAVFNWVYICSIRLRDLSDYFENLPISRGLNMRITLNYNSFRATYTTTANTVVDDVVTAAGTIKTTSYTQLSGNTCPIMIASLAIGNANDGSSPGSTGGLSVPTVPAGVLTVACGIVSNAVNTTFKPALSTTRIYVDAYKLDPNYQSTLLKTVPVSTVRYFDFYSFPILNISPGSTFNQILSNGIPNLRGIVCIPYPAVAGETTTLLTMTPFQNAFDSAPFTTAPSGSITQFQILIAGSNVWNQNMQYDWESWNYEVQHFFAIHGGNVTGVNSGLISKYMFDNAYRYYCCDVSRRIPFENSIPKSVQVLGTNNTSATMSYVCLVLFEKQLEINTATGEIIASSP